MKSASVSSLTTAMAQEDFEQFRRLVLRDAALQAQLRATPDEARFLALTVRLATNVVRLLAAQWVGSLYGELEIVRRAAESVA